MGSLSYRDFVFVFNNPFDETFKDLPVRTPVYFAKTSVGWTVFFRDSRHSEKIRFYSIDLSPSKMGGVEIAYRVGRKFGIDITTLRHIDQGNFKKNLDEIKRLIRLHGGGF